MAHLEILVTCVCAGPVFCRILDSCSACEILLMPRRRYLTADGFAVILWASGAKIFKKTNSRKMLPQLTKAVAENPKKVAILIDIVNLSTVLRDFMGQSQSSQLTCFKRVWCYIKKDNNLQDPVNRNVVNCDPKLQSILLGKTKIDLTELPQLVKLHFPKQPK